MELYGPLIGIRIQTLTVPRRILLNILHTCTHHEPREQWAQPLFHASVHVHRHSPIIALGTTRGSNTTCADGHDAIAAKKQ